MGCFVDLEGPDHPAQVAGICLHGGDRIDVFKLAVERL